MKIKWAKAGELLHESAWQERPTYDEHGRITGKTVHKHVKPFHEMDPGNAGDYTSGWLCLDCNKGKGRPITQATHLRNCMERGHRLAWFCAWCSDVEQVIPVVE